MPLDPLARIDRVLARWLPEQRLFLRSEHATRFLRLRPTAQAGALIGVIAVFGWAIVVSSILMIDRVSSFERGDQIARARAGFETRLNELSRERDVSASEAQAAQARFSVALDEVSRMQSELLSAQQAQRELRAGLSVTQDNLRQALAEQPAPVAQIADAADQATAETADTPAEMTLALDVLNGELDRVSEARDAARDEAAAARLQAELAKFERDQLVTRNNEVFAQLEDAVTVSVKPFEEMFAKIGIDADALMATVEEGYAGQGGPLTPMGYSSHGDADISATESRANKVIVSLDKVNRYRIASSKLPLAMPVKSAFRYTSGFGRRWGRMHKGIDLAAPVGTPIYSSGEGEVIFAGRQRGYGNIIKIKHALGTETRYAHLSRIRVKVGQKVSRGTRIGDMGNTGRSTGSHLHYEIRVNGTAINPMSFIKAAQNVF